MLLNVKTFGEEQTGSGGEPHVLGGIFRADKWSVFSINLARSKLVLEVSHI